MKSGIRDIARGAAVVAVLALLTACGGGDSGPPSIHGTRSAASHGLPARAWYCKTEVALISDQCVGHVHLATRMPSARSYAVTVKSSPTSPQGCLVADGVGNRSHECDECVGNLRKRLYGRWHGFGLQGIRIGTSTFRIRRSRPRAGGTTQRANVGPPLRITSNGPFTFGIVFSGEHS
jgi:hypothetical protein